MYQNLPAHDWVMVVINVLSRITEGWNPPNTWFQGYFFDINSKPPPILNKIANPRSLSFFHLWKQNSLVYQWLAITIGNCFAKRTIFILVVGIFQSVSALLLSFGFFLGVRYSCCLWKFIVTHHVAILFLCHDVSSKDYEKDFLFRGWNLWTLARVNQIHYFSMLSRLWKFFFHFLSKFQKQRFYGWKPIT
jgi:hypothetical protein